jgi:hypothetical protein
MVRLHGATGHQNGESNMKLTTEEPEYFTKEMYDRERREVLIELSALEEKWLELKDRLDAADVHTAMLRFAQVGEDAAMLRHAKDGEEGMPEPGGWIFLHSGDHGQVIQGLTDAINCTVMDIKEEAVDKVMAIREEADIEIDRLENPEDYKD